MNLAIRERLAEDLRHENRDLGDELLNELGVRPFLTCFPVSVRRGVEVRTE